MKFCYFAILLLTVIFATKNMCAQELKPLSKVYGIVSEPYAIPDDDQPDFKDIAYRFGWKRKSPCSIGIQFINSGYVDRTIKFAIQDISLNQMIILDPVHNSRFGSETIKANSYSVIWSGPVDNIKDNFLLRIWNSNGDKFDQAPVSILNAWIQKPTITPAVIVDINSKKTINAEEKLSDEITTTPTPAITLTPIPTPTSKSIYLILGDSWIAGDGRSANGSPMWALTLAGLSLWYPQIQSEHMTYPGARAADWIPLLPKLFADYAKKGVPISYVLFVAGPKEFRVAYHPVDCEDCCKGATLSQGVSLSYVFQKDFSQAVSEIYTADPDVNLVVTTAADFAGKPGTITPEGVFDAYAQRLYELQAKYPKMRIANIDQAMYGHPEYFCPLGDPEYTHPNDLGQAIMSLIILEQFANWPYQPSKK